MQAIIPLAGKGTRVRPHTHSTPKALMRVANRPVLSYVVEQLRAEGVDELIFITGHLDTQIRSYMSEEYAGLSVRYVPQEVPRGTADAVALAEPYVTGPVLIVFVDTLFDADLSVLTTRSEDSGIIWAKEVEDYQRFGVILTDAEGYMTRIVEKPSEPISKLANIGFYYLKDHELLFEGVSHVMGQDDGTGELYLTDAFQYMIDNGAKLFTAEVDGWFDCGKPETLLETNRVMVDRGHGAPDDLPPGSQLEGGVALGPGVVIEESVLGPNVSVAEGSSVRKSVLSNTIVGAGSVLRNCELTDSLVGDRVVLEGVCGKVNIGDDSTVETRRIG